MLNKISLINPEKRKFKKILEIIPKDKKMKFIDIGCEYGLVTNFLHEREYDITGIDINPLVIKMARKNYPRIKFEVKDVFEVKFSRYDIIIAWGLFEYIFRLDELLKKIEREMKPGSIIIFAVPNVCSLSKRLRSILGINPNRETKPTMVFTFKDIKKIISKLKFRQKEITTTYCDGISNFYFPTPKSLSREVIVKMIK